MLAVAKAEHLDVVRFDEATCWRDVSHGTAENAVARPGECALLDCDVIEEANGLDFDTRIREGGEPAAEERGAGRLSITAHPAWRPECDIVGKDFRKSVNVMGVECCCALFEGFARGHRHWILLRSGECEPEGRAGDDRSLNTIAARMRDGSVLGHPIKDKGRKRSNNSGRTPRSLFLGDSS